MSCIAHIWCPLHLPLKNITRLFLWSLGNLWALNSLLPDSKKKNSPAFVAGRQELLLNSRQIQENLQEEKKVISPDWAGTLLSPIMKTHLRERPSSMLNSRSSRFDSSSFSSAVWWRSVDRSFVLWAVGSSSALILELHQLSALIQLINDTWSPISPPRGLVPPVVTVKPCRVTFHWLYWMCYSTFTSLKYLN